MSETPELDEVVEIFSKAMATAIERNGDGGHVDVDPDAIVFEPLRDFLARELPPSESLVGVPRGGTNLLPRYGWVMPWGREGSGKTSVLVDLLFHAAAGIDWLSYPVARPLRVVCVVNEGVPGGLQDKLAQKVEAWEGDVEAVLDNLAIYASPWGEFTFRDEVIVAHARDFVADFEADYIALDPLHTLGIEGAGAPAETEAFKHTLRHFGLWETVGVITAHHANKGGMVSGDWGRHPDTVLRLEKDGKNASTKVTVEKARPADPHELGVPFLLDWVVDSLSYVRREIARVETSPVDEEAVLAEVVRRLAERAEQGGRYWALDPILKGIEGTLEAKRDVVKKAIEDGLIANLARPAEPGKKQMYALALVNVENAPTLIDVQLSTDAVNGSTDTNLYVGEGVDAPDVQVAAPKESAERGASGLSLERPTLTDVHVRADVDVSDGLSDEDNPLLR